MENKTMKLYKFRPLGSCKDLERAQEIIKTGKFWCSRYWELNDPMEGVYWYYNNTMSDENIAKLHTRKGVYVICSFSGRGDGECSDHEKHKCSRPKGFANPTMWGYYANGFRGMAIEIEVKVDCNNNIHRMNYVKTPLEANNNDMDPNNILTAKWNYWRHEDEYRYLVESKRNRHSIGKITGIYFGNPYGKIAKQNDTCSKDPIRKYICRAQSLQETARKKSIDIHYINVENDGSIKSEPISVA